MSDEDQKPAEEPTPPPAPTEETPKDTAPEGGATPENDTPAPEGDAQSPKDGEEKPNKEETDSLKQKLKGLKDNPKRLRTPIVVWVLIAVLLYSIFSIFTGESGSLSMPKQDAKTEELSQLNFWDRVEGKKELKKCRLIRNSDDNSVYIEGTFEGEKKPFKINFVGVEGVEDRLAKAGVDCTSETTRSFWGPILVTLLPTLLFFALIYFFFVRQRGGAMEMGRSRAKLLNKDAKKIKFDDVAGVDEAKEEVQEIVDFLKAPKKFEALGGKVPKGVLLMGPPGTGKTLLAKAIAGEADVPFFSISGSDFVEMFVGVGASRVRDMFEQGKKNAPCIIFIDEIDAVGRSRFTGIGGGHDEREQTLNAMLVEMDGFDSNTGVIVMAATNRSDVLDPALTRPGRFDRQIVVDLPTVDGRLEILKIHAKKLKLGPDADLSRIARGTPGFSGADLANLLNEGALIAVRAGKSAIEHTDLEEARDKVLWGRERRSMRMADKERRITAWHEGGHALAQVLCRNTEPVHKVTIIPRGRALGATMTLPERDVLNHTLNEMKDMLVVLCAGRIAEKLYTGDISTGASSDIRMASNLARKMVCSYGMSKNFGFQAFGDNEDMVFLGRDVGRKQDHSEATAQAIDEEVNLLLKEAYARCENLIRDNRSKLETLVEFLLKVETADGRDVEDLIRLGHIREHQVPAPAATPETPSTEASVAEPTEATPTSTPAEPSTETTPPEAPAPTPEPPDTKDA